MKFEKGDDYESCRKYYRIDRGYASGEIEQD